MPKQLLLTAMIDLPDNLFDQADVLSTVRPAWNRLRDDLAATPMSVGCSFDTAMEITEAKRSAPAKKPERKKRAIMPPQDLAPDGAE